ncbi:MAG: hypothetical protein K8I03_14210 [Ignavibacteria bacterium]|nr:hypothetical protein [Ignavibacteria bacterium]
MRYVIIAILIYLAFLLIRSLLRNNINRSAKTSSPKDKKTHRTYNLDQVQDAEFREIKKD